MTSIARHKTAMVRDALSRPMSMAVSDSLIAPGRTVFDYGCGRGDDLRHLEALGYQASGWDPGHRPDAEHCHADVVNLGYVVNVIEDRAERARTLAAAWELAKRVLVVSARLVWDARDLVGRRHSDGVITRTGTFQKFYEQPELAAWITQVLGVTPVAAAPGIFYVFRCEEDQQQFLHDRVHTYRPRVRIDPHERYESTKELLSPLFDFMSAHARPPRTLELDTGAQEAIKVEFGSVGRAQKLIYAVTGDDYWEQVRIQRRAELLVYIAMSRFGRRPRFSQLARTLQTDVKVHFGTYKDACIQGDRMLVATGDPMLVFVSARSSKVGKQTPSALYVHRSALGELPPLLRVYEGCARVLSGNVERANMIKLSVVKPQVSYLSYPKFDKDAHPVLESAVTVNLRHLTVDWRDYSKSDNPPLLHRKEEFVSESDPRRDLYARLTRAEMRAGLYSDPSRIGSLHGWERQLMATQYQVFGHRLRKMA
ncbi:DNA phosphorothioation-associated putative methyltransferase [Hoyosella rhizosphaerae]|nr:DNA phosphorothioation-associated putative methyltransferase [Hoyosella rhizosphaerae]MBN4927160.1 DNA phosphorothioation-associated putative methyltransferase [Hoyosella rhizosphaerae]